MEQQKFEIRMMEYLSGELDENESLSFEKLLQDNPGYQLEFNSMRKIWTQVNNKEMPDPSQKMDAIFCDMLNAEIDKNDSASKGWLENLVTFLSPIQKPQIAFGMLLLGIGLCVGYFLNSNAESSILKDTVVINDETQKVREELVLTLLDQPSANKRLQAMNEASKLNKATERIIEALFATLNNDSNINVRLVAIESLARYVETPEVRMGLVKSIALQNSPLVQIALADLMVALQEKTSIESMKQLLKKPDINTTVKQKLEESINHII